MALQKQPININFAKGLDTKTDPNQVQLGNFLSLTNSVFTTGGRLTKRNGFKQLTTAPAGQTTLTTFNDNLIATGTDLQAYIPELDKWYDKGTIQPVTIATQPVSRSSANQTNPDLIVSQSGIACAVFLEGTEAYYQIFNSVTGQQVINKTGLESGAQNVRVFSLGASFVITYTVGTAPLSLKYITIPVATPTMSSSPTTITSTIANVAMGYDCVVANNNLYFVWCDVGNTIEMTYLSASLVLQSAVLITTQSIAVRYFTLTADTSTSTPVIWAAYEVDSGVGTMAAFAVSSTLVTILAPVTFSMAGNKPVSAITSAASNNVLTIIWDVGAFYASPYPVSVRTDHIATVTVTIAGVVGTPTAVVRSIGLASKAFIGPSGTIYALAAYGSTNQPSYFVIDASGNVYGRLAYSNGGGYLASSKYVLPNVTTLNGSYYTAYLFQDLLATTNKNTNNASGTPVNSIYTQTGVNMVKLEINASGQYSSEIANALHLTGGQLWEYDGVKPVEHGFQVWPEDLQITTSGTGGSISAGTYFYQFTYEWTDNAGNIHRSAPSIPLQQTVTGSTNKNTIYVPTLRLTYKTDGNPVRIVGYRWSTNQQTYYQFTSISSPVLNDTTVDFVVIQDTLNDSAILGNNILYTTGGVLENIAAPASTASAMFKNRLFLIDAEDRNLLWYSKVVLEATPVEFNDGLTLYIAPTTGTQGSTGPTLAISSMDDKLIIFKKDAIYYITGSGPDNTGANNDFTDPIFITSSVGSSNPNSIVLTQDGLMFQSDKGIWLLGRDLSTVYIGAQVESFNSQVIESAQVIPGTTQVRFTLDNNVILMYDYFYRQWGTFTSLYAISSTIYNGLHTYLNKYSAVLQESPGEYLDGSAPVLMSFTTSWINVGGLQGFERFYFMYLLGTYYTPFTLTAQIAYNYNPNPIQSVKILPTEYSKPWGDEPQWGGGSNWGGGQGTGASSDSSANVFSARMFPSQQKCESFLLIINEYYDPSLGVAAGQGLSLSGLNLVVGVKRGFRTQRAANSFG